MRRLVGGIGRMSTAGILCLIVILLYGGLSGARPEQATAPVHIPPKVSLEMQDADIRDVLRLLAALGGVNIVIGPGVKGTVTMRLEKVSWQQALDGLLRVHGLVQERQGNMVVVLPRERWLHQGEQQVHARQLAGQGQPVVTHVVPIKYRDAAELKAVLEPHLRACASLTVDARTNTLLITGTPSCLRQP